LRVGQSVSQSAKTAADGQRIDAGKPLFALRLVKAKARNPRGMPSPELLETCNTLHRSTRNLLIQIFPRQEDCQSTGGQCPGAAHAVESRAAALLNSQSLLGSALQGNRLAATGSLIQCSACDNLHCTTDVGTVNVCLILIKSFG
jgi:hypothetical protein